MQKAVHSLGLGSFIILSFVQNSSCLNFERVLTVKVVIMCEFVYLFLQGISEGIHVKMVACSFKDLVNGLRK